MELIKEPNKLTVKYTSIGFGALLMIIGAVFFYQLYLQYIAHPNRFSEKMGGLAAGGAICFIMGWFSACQKVYVFDKVKGTFKWNRKRLLWYSGGEIKLSEIKRVVVEKGSMSETRQNEITRLSIWTDYKTIPFTAGLTNRGLADYSLARDIKAFLGLREEEEPDMQPLNARINSLLDAGNKADAIKLLRREHNIPLNEAHQKITEMMQSQFKSGSSPLMENKEGS